LCDQKLFGVESPLFGGGGGSGGGGGGAPAAAGAGGAEQKAAAAAPAAEKKEKTEYDIKLTKFDDKQKINVIKIVRAVSGLGVKEVNMDTLYQFSSFVHNAQDATNMFGSQAKTLVESAPAVIKQKMKKDEAAKVLQQLKEAGAEAVLE